jgi:hypothetical protein
VKYSVYSSWEDFSHSSTEVFVKHPLCRTNLSFFDFLSRCYHSLGTASFFEFNNDICDPSVRNFSAPFILSQSISTNIGNCDRVTYASFTFCSIFIITTLLYLSGTILFSFYIDYPSIFYNPSPHQSNGVGTKQRLKWMESNLAVLREAEIDRWPSMRDT